MKWVLNMIVLPLLTSFNNSHVCLLDWGSMPDVGSSKITNCFQEFNFKIILYDVKLKFYLYLKIETTQIFVYKNLICSKNWYVSELFIYITLEPPTRAIAIESFLFIPPDKKEDLLSFLSSRPTCFIIFSASSFASLFVQPFSCWMNLTHCQAK